MFFKLNLVSCLLFVTLLASSATARLAKRFADEIQEVSANAPNANIWVVLVAGSNGYYNYRHQSDVLHAYHLIHKLNNVPKDRIILMMYDDIAYAEENPFPGNIINYPKGENLYTPDVVKDYVGKDVSPENFVGVLLKDPKLVARNKKVLNSTSEDFVFVYFTDHGAPSMVAFPNGILTAVTLNKTLTLLQQRNAFNKMVIYIEACESGSMFADDMNPKHNIYAVTASSFNEPSYAIYWDDDRKTYLADEFSINWLLDSYSLETENQEETLFNQYLHVKNKTLDSHVCEFGDIQMAYEYDTSDFQGHTRVHVKSESLRKAIESDLPRDAIRSDEVEFNLARIHSELNDDDSFERLVRGRRLLNQFMNSLKSKFAVKLGVDRELLSGKNKNENLDCYEHLLNHFNEDCIPLHLHTFLFRHLYLFVNSCNAIKQNDLQVTAQDLNTIVSLHCGRARRSFVSMAKVF